MRKIFLDTNIILDLLAQRIPHYESIARIATLAEQRELALIASPVSFTTISYVLSKIEPFEVVLNRLRKFSILCKISEVNQETIDKSLNSDFSDFEDAVQYFSAVDAGCKIILTRNTRDFKKSGIPVMTADEYLKSRSF